MLSQSPVPPLTAESEGKESKEEDKSPEHISIESAEDQEPVAAAALVADSKLGNVQSPASVWLPYRDTNVNRNKVNIPLRNSPLLLSSVKSYPRSLARQISSADIKYACSAACRCGLCSQSMYMLEAAGLSFTKCLEVRCHAASGKFWSCSHHRWW